MKFRLCVVTDIQKSQIYKQQLVLFYHKETKMKLNTTYNTKSITDIRICLRCGTRMSNNYKIYYPEGFALGNATTFFITERQRIKCSVCPKCGEVSFYIDNPEDITD